MDSPIPGVESIQAETIIVAVEIYLSGLAQIKLSPPGGPYDRYAEILLRLAGAIPPAHGQSLKNYPTPCITNTLLR